MTRLERFRFRPRTPPPAPPPVVVPTAEEERFSLAEQKVNTAKATLEDVLGRYYAFCEEHGVNPTDPTPDALSIDLAKQYYELYDERMKASTEFNHLLPEYADAKCALQESRGK